MPAYAYGCKSCEHEFDRVLPISKRKVPESEPCPECGGDQVTMRIKPRGNNIVAGVNMEAPMSSSKTPDGFKDVLRTIKANSGRGCKIDV